MTHKENFVWVISGGFASRGPGPRKQESEQPEDVLRMCRVSQLVVRISQPIVRDGNRVRRVRGEVARKVPVIFLIFTDDPVSILCICHRSSVTETHLRQAPPCTKHMSGAGTCGDRWGTNKSNVCKGLGLISFVYGISKYSVVMSREKGEKKGGPIRPEEGSYPTDMRHLIMTSWVAEYNN